MGGVDVGGMRMVEQTTTRMHRYMMWRSSMNEFEAKPSSRDCAKIIQKEKESEQ